MCRPEKPITTSNKALRELAEWLRDQRERTRQGYRSLSMRAGCHATTLQRAASGETVPKLQTVLNYARACDASPEEARRLWRRARYEQTRRVRGGRGLPAPSPGLIRDFVDLSAALQDLYERAGSPALRTMEQRAGGYGALPRSTAHRIVTKQTMPHSLQQFQAYLRACEIPEADWPGWEAAWTRAWRHEKRDELLGTSSTTDVDALVALGEMASKQILQEAGDVVIARDGAIRRLAARANHNEARRVARRGPGGISRHLAERSVPGQLAFPVSESAPKADALF